MAPISFPRKGSRLLTLVPTFYVLKEQRGKRALVRASVWRFNGSSKGFAPARPQVVEQQTSGLAVLGSHEGKPSGQRVLFAAKVYVYADDLACFLHRRVEFCVRVTHGLPPPSFFSRASAQLLPSKNPAHSRCDRRNPVEPL